MQRVFLDVSIGGKPIGEVDFTVDPVVTTVGADFGFGRDYTAVTTITFATKPAGTLATRYLRSLYRHLRRTPARRAMLAQRRWHRVRYVLEGRWARFESYERRGADMRWCRVIRGEVGPWFATVTDRGLDVELRTFARRCDAKRWCEMVTARGARR